MQRWGWLVFYSGVCSHFLRPLLHQLSSSRSCFFVHSKHLRIRRAFGEPLAVFLVLLAFLTVRSAASWLSSSSPSRCFLFFFIVLYRTTFLQGEQRKPTCWCYVYSSLKKRGEVPARRGIEQGLGTTLRLGRRKRSQQHLPSERSALSCADCGSGRDVLPWLSDRKQWRSRGRASHILHELLEPLFSYDLEPSLPSLSECESTVVTGGCEKMRHFLGERRRDLAAVLLNEGCHIGMLLFEATKQEEHLPLKPLPFNV